MVRFRWNHFLAAIALGLRVIVLSAELDTVAAHRAQVSFPNIVHVEYVEHVCGRSVQKVLMKRNFSAVIVGGGSPC